MNALHPRYTLPEMAALWTDEAKFRSWLEVELAYLKARAFYGHLSEVDVRAIEARAKVDVKRIAEIEEVTVHDLLAFVEQVRETLKDDGDSRLAGLFHTGLTSYDVEDPALMLLMRRALELVIQSEERLRDTLVERAKEHQWTLMIARSHGQFAEPTTFGIMLLEFAHAVERDVCRLSVCRHELSCGKMSGAVGSYGELSPAVEDKALGLLGLNTEMATQILGRDTHASVLNALAIAAGTIERISRTLWQMARSDVGELEEPRKSTQKGSSAMAHKKNPIKLEQLFGLPRLVRGYAHAAVENIASLEARDISQSSVERHVIPGAFALTHYLAVTMQKVITGLVVHNDVMDKNLNKRTLGVWASQQIRNRLIAKGIDPEQAYEYVQRLCFTAVNEGRHLMDVSGFPAMVEGDCSTRVDRLLTGSDYLDCMDARAYIKDGVEHLFNSERGLGGPVIDMLRRMTTRE